jgi:ATP-dependent DNA helicase 2 subunit 2
MFVVDVSPSMGHMRTVELPGEDKTDRRTTTMTNLQWSLQYVMYKIQEMVRIHPLFSKYRTLTALKIFHNRKTDQCGVMLFGTEGRLACISIRMLL